MPDAKPSAPLPKRILRPLEAFVSTEVLGSMLLLAATVVALVWANLPGTTYEEFWSRTTSWIPGHAFDLTLVAWVNDGLMALFFFVVGMEIKREVVRGELSGARKAALPVAAAMGGMLAPAAIYLAFNAGGAGERGWGIPMATDIAFSLGVLALLGSRIPVGLKVFLLALAIVDDIGAIAVIAVFYTDDLEPAWLIASVALIAASWLAIRAGVRSGVLFTAAAVAAWFAMHESGIHATLAGVAFGLLVPVDAATSAADSRWSLPALDNIEEELHPWTSYVIVPLFALANAGVVLGSDALSDASTSRITLGVVFGLGIGKPLGILIASWLAVRSGAGVLPENVGWAQILGAGLIAGIGFTVSLFIAELAFTDETLVAEAKIAILGVSVLMAILGLAYLYILTRAGARVQESG